MYILANKAAVQGLKFRSKVNVLDTISKSETWDIPMLHRAKYSIKFQLFTQHSLHLSSVGFGKLVSETEKS